MIRVRTETKQDAVEHVIRMHNDRVAYFKQARQRLLAECASADLDAIGEYLELLTNVINGNLRATKYLIGAHYPGASERLSQLIQV
jgi:hypothetical protein